MPREKLLMRRGRQFYKRMVDYREFTDVREASDLFLVSENVVRYWDRKRSDPSYHPGRHGGHKSYKYNEQKREHINSIISEILQRDARTSLKQYKEILNEHGYNLSTSSISRIFRSWNYTWKKVQNIEKKKFTIENKIYYFIFYSAINSLPKYRLKFLDECHFDNRNLHNTYARAPSNEEVFVVNHHSFSHETKNMSMLTSLTSNPPLFYRIRTSSNTQYDTLYFIAEAIKEDYLKPDDYLILDNATVHKGSSTFTEMYNLCSCYNVKIRFLPTYSPELNPIELCFAVIKKYFRNHRKDDEDIEQCIRLAINTIDNAMVERMYDHCRDLPRERQMI
eukprot:gb/GECH01010722.1/.p1 GENE.gb/GECH01010722.1/~~gb/GECH01010722.1/.p1  ORF type:complete len:336 (+),score=18.50 gb/GECH01010722.1/:1-1008(+)